MSYRCRVCLHSPLTVGLDLGPQSIRNRYLDTPDTAEYRHPFRVGCCVSCGTVQLIDPPPVDQLRPRHEWIRYNEPEHHLDELVETLARLPGITCDSHFAGLSYKDDSTLARLNRHGFAATWRPDSCDDLGIKHPHSGIESIQRELTVTGATRLVAKFDQPDVLLVRHVLEHTHDTRAALDWAARLVRPGGYVVFEVPDATRALDRLDYTTLWEEHTLYFTPDTLRRCMEVAGFEVLSLESYLYTLENSLVVIARFDPGRTAILSQPIREEFDRADRFLALFARTRDRIRRQLSICGRVAMLGAGHMTSAFINGYGLGDRIDFVVDDNPHKQGRFMPGSRLQILPSCELVTREIDLCLMTVRPEIEESVLANNAEFVAGGGVLASVFPESPYGFDRIMRREEQVV